MFHDFSCSFGFVFQIDEMANNFGKGLRVTGLNPMDRICIFAETKADWLVCALGCFKQTFPLVTLYANLGDDAIAHGVNETEVTHGQFGCGISNMVGPKKQAFCPRINMLKGNFDIA